MLTDLPARPLDAAMSPAPAAPGANTEDGNAAWPLAGRFAFRWFAAYFVLYCLPFPIGMLPGPLSAPAGWWQRATDSVLPWLGRTVFGLPTVNTGFPTGSGDTLANYMTSFLFAMVAL